MPIFIVTMTHPDGVGWNRALAAHVTYLQDLVAAGTLLASGPLRGEGLRRGFLIVEAPDRAAVDTIVRADPFATAGLIVHLDVQQWDPLFGILHDRSSRDVDALLAKATTLGDQPEPDGD